MMLLPDRLSSEIRLIIDEFGPDIIIESKFVSILTYRNAYADYPDSNKILRDLKASGGMDDIYKIYCNDEHDWKPSILYLEEQFYNDNEYDRALVHYVLSCIVYGLHLTDKLDKYDVETNSYFKRLRNVEFHEALKDIISREDPRIIKEKRLVYILDDFKVFDNYSSTRYILKAIITGGYSESLLMIGKWDISVVSLIHKCVIETGFQKDMVNYVFQTMAYALGYIDLVNTHGEIHVKTKMSSKKVIDTSNLNLRRKEIINRGVEFEKDYKKDCEEYIDSIIEAKGDWDNWGAIINISSSYIIYDYISYIEINVEIDGKISMLKDNDIVIHMITYNQQGHIIDRSSTYIGRETYKNTFRVITLKALREELFYYIGNISKVVIYWEVD